MRWAAIRAGLIALAIFVGLLDGLPMPTPSERPTMERRLTPGMVKAVDALDEVRLEILEPLRPVSDGFHVRQRFKLFAGASRRRFRMQIEARTGPTAEWQLLYRVLDDEHDFMAPALQYRRARGMWNPHTKHGPRGGFNPFAKWVAQRVFDADPAYADVRVQYERILIGPRGGYRPTGEMVYPVLVRRPLERRP